MELPVASNESPPGSPRLPPQPPQAPATAAGGVERVETAGASARWRGARSSVGSDSEFCEDSESLSDVTVVAHQAGVVVGAELGELLHER